MGIKDLYYDKQFMSNLMKILEGGEYHMSWFVFIQNQQDTLRKSMPKNALYEL